MLTETIQGLYTFRRDGTCTQTSIVTDKNGKEQRRVVNMRWAFYDQSSSTIYFGSDHYWDIEELTTKKFAIYDRLGGEYGEINMSREYKEFTPLDNFVIKYDKIMSQLPTLIADLALILICAGVMTLLFKKLKQPLVLGYVVAGFLASPHMPYTPSVMDTANIKTWADIGVIFLLFALGLEFSFKKIVKVGGSAIIAACTIIFCMILLGIGVGMGFGWHRMDSLFLGGMIAMSSTTIIYKAFDDLGLRKKQFTGLVLSILILEDILAIVLMVMLSTMAVSQHFERYRDVGEYREIIVFPYSVVCCRYLSDS